MDPVIILILNIVITIALVNFSIWLFQYDMKWWLRNQRAKNLLNGHFKKRVLLEIKVPREVSKSPAAMELFLGTISSQNLGYSVKGLIDKTNEELKINKKGISMLFAIWKNWSKWWFEFRKYWQDKYLKGGMRMWFSLEIISEEGKIRFFLYTYDKLVDLQRNALYAQYPGIEVVEVEDYTLKHHYTPGGNLNLYVGNWKLKKDDYLPIKTYVDYGMDKDPKEEFKVDPLQSLLETMSTAGKGEHFWYQILLRPTINDNWKKQSRDRIDRLLKIERYKKDDPEVVEKKVKEGDVKEQKGGMLSLSPELKKEVEIISKNLEKDGLDCFVRFYGLKYKDKPDDRMSVSKNILPIVYAMKPFDSVGYNAFGFKTITTDSDYPELDPNGTWSNKLREQGWENYVLRTGMYFEAENLPYQPWVFWKIYKTRLKAVPTKEWANGFKKFILSEYYAVPEIHAGQMDEFVLNTEEVATLFHIPSKINGTTNNVIGSIKADPPLNLPF